MTLNQEVKTALITGSYDGLETQFINIHASRGQALKSNWTLHMRCLQSIIWKTLTWLPMILDIKNLTLSYVPLVFGKEWVSVSIEEKKINILV